MDETRYQVFVSSTFTDLMDEREKVLQAILQVRAFPAGMELFPAADDDQFDFIKREIDSSDYYVLILGGRYGSVDDDGVSFTEREYDYARQTGKPILAFIVRDRGKLIGDKLERSEALTFKLDAFTAKAKKGKLVNFYASPDELKSAVLVSLQSQFNLKPMRGWVRAGQTPREVLERVTDLQNEVLALREENARLASSQDPIVEALSQGSDTVTWDLALDDFAVNQQYPTVRKCRLSATWDDLLSCIFQSGSSQQTADQVKRNIGVYILVFEPEPLGTLSWRDAIFQMLKNFAQVPPISAIDKIYGDVLRQFSGLGLVSATKETIYVPIPHSQGSQAKTEDMWKLEKKGQQRLALIRGYKRQ